MGNDTAGIDLPRRARGRNALTIDSGPPHGFRIRVEYPEELDQYGRDRFTAVLADALDKLVAESRRSDPADPRFEHPGR